MQYEGTHVTIRITTRALNCLFVREDEKAVKPRARFPLAAASRGLRRARSDAACPNIVPPRDESRSAPILNCRFVRANEKAVKAARQKTNGRSRGYPPRSVASRHSSARASADADDACARAMHAPSSPVVDIDDDDDDERAVHAMALTRLRVGGAKRRMTCQTREACDDEAMDDDAFGSSQSLVDLVDAFMPAPVSSGAYLGFGACGTVRAGTRERTGEVVALKTMKCYDRENAAQALNEIRILRKLNVGMSVSSSSSVSSSDVSSCGSFGTLTGRARRRSKRSKREASMMSEDPHAGIVRCVGAGFDARANSMTLGLEIMALGSLERIWRTHGSMARAPRAAMAVARCVTNGLAYLHDKVGVAHRDVKPSNILVDEDGACKLSDFGLCSPLTYVVGGANGQSSKVVVGAAADPDAVIRRVGDDSMVGTIAYMSPERVSRGLCSDVADVWGMGITILESILGRGVFDIEDGGPLGLVVQICEEDIDIDGAVPGDDAVSIALRATLKRCLEKKPGLRATARELVFDSELNLSSYSYADVRTFIHTSLDSSNAKGATHCLGHCRPRSPTPGSVHSDSNASDDTDVVVDNDIF